MIEFKTVQKVEMVCPYCKEDDDGWFDPQVEMGIVEFISRGQLICPNCGNTIAAIEPLGKDEFVVKTAKAQPIEITEPIVVASRDEIYNEEDD